MGTAFKINPGEKHADYLPRLREHNARASAETAPVLQAIDADRRGRRVRLLAAVSTIPNEMERAFALSQI